MITSLSLVWVTVSLEMKNKKGRVKLNAKVLGSIPAIANKTKPTAPHGADASNQELAGLVWRPAGQCSCRRRLQEGQRGHLAIAAIAWW